MKKGTIIIIIAAALIVAGIFCVGVGFWRNGMTFKNLDNEKYKTETYNVSENFDNLSIKISSQDVKILRAADGTAKVVCHEIPESAEVRASVQNGALEISYKEKNGKWYDNIHFGSIYSYIEVYIPDDISDIMIDTSSSDVKIKNVTCCNITVNSSSGDLAINDTVLSGTLNVTQSSGDVSYNKIDAADISIETSSGDVKIENVTCCNITGKSSSGDLAINDTALSGALNIKQISGDVSFDNMDAADITIETSSGDVSGRLSSPKVFIVKTSSGDVNVPESLTGAPCRIKTSSGDIKIRIK